MTLTGNRLESFSFDLMDEDEALLETLTTVTGGELIHDADTDLRHAGRITLTDDGTSWLDKRVRVTYHDGADSYPLGVFLTAAPGRSTDGTRTSIAVELYSKLLVLSQDKYATSYTLGAASNVTDTVKALITAAGETHLAVTDSAEVTAEARVWQAGTSVLQVVNDLLSSINYFSLDVDVRGYYVARPYVAPASRAVAWTFTEGPAALFKPAMTADADYFFIPNKAVLVAGSAETELVGIATDTTSEYGYTARGRWITDFRSGEEATSQDIIDDKAARVLAESRQVTEAVEITHPYLPISLNDAVVATHAMLGTTVRYTVNGWRHALTIGASCSTSLRRVIV